MYIFLRGGPPACGILGSPLERLEEMGFVGLPPLDDVLDLIGQSSTTLVSSSVPLDAIALPERARMLSL